MCPSSAGNVPRQTNYLCKEGPSRRRMASTRLLELLGCSVAPWRSQGTIERAKGPGLSVPTSERYARSWRRAPWTARTTPSVNVGEQDEDEYGSRFRQQHRHGCSHQQISQPTGSTVMLAHGLLLAV